MLASIGMNEQGKATLISSTPAVVGNASPPAIPKLRTLTEIAYFRCEVVRRFIAAAIARYAARTPKTTTVVPLGLIRAADRLPHWRLRRISAQFARDG